MPTEFEVTGIERITLITRRSEVRILPPLLNKPPNFGWLFQLRSPLRPVYILLSTASGISTPSARFRVRSSFCLRARQSPKSSCKTSETSDPS